MGAWVQTKAPTCTEKGEERSDCSRCDHFETREVDALGHIEGTREWIIDKEPTCTEPGLKHQNMHCGRCDADLGEVADSEETIAALGHEFGEWILETPMSVTEAGVPVAGVEKCYCIRKDAEQSRELWPVAQNMRTGELYETLEEALDDTTGETVLMNGDTVRLLVDLDVAELPEGAELDHEEEGMAVDTVQIIRPMTLDLEGHKLRVISEMSYHPEADVIDSTTVLNADKTDFETEGRLIVPVAIVSGDKAVLAAGNSYLPIRIAEESTEEESSYILINTVKMQQLTEPEMNADGSMTFRFRPSLGSKAVNESYFGTDGAADEDLSIGMRLTYTSVSTDEDGNEVTTTKYMDLIYTDELVLTAYATNQLFRLTVDGVDLYFEAYDMSITSVLISETGVEFRGAEVTVPEDTTTEA